MQKSLADRCGRQALSLFSNLNPRDWSTFRNHLERMLGRQAYNDGKAAVALSHFLNVIVEDASNEGPTKEEGQDFLDDLQLAWNSLGRTADDIARSTGLKLPEKIFDPKRTAIHSKILNPAAIRSDTEAWTSLEQLFLEHGFPYTPEGSRAVVKKPASLLDDITLNIATVEGKDRKDTLRCTSMLFADPICRGFPGRSVGAKRA